MGFALLGGPSQVAYALCPSQVDYALCPSI